MLLAANPAHANQTVNQPTDTVKSAPAQPLAEIVFERPNLKSHTPAVAAPQSDDESPMLDFTDAESTSAIQKYGCGCSNCLNAVRQLQGELPLL